MRLINHPAKIVFLFLLSLTFSFQSFGQEPIYSVNWKVLSETADYKIEFKTMDCDRPTDDLDKNELILKVTNLTNVKVDISWGIEYYYNNKCLNCASQSTEYTGKVSVDANSSVEGKCDVENRELRHFIQFLNIDNKSILTDFKVKNVKIVSAATLNQSK